MSKWNIIEAAQYHRDLKKMLKKYPRETRQMLVNLVRYREALEGGDNPLLLVQFPFVHRESSGCHALTQQPLSSAAQTRLYLYCHIDEHNLHLICLGDKHSQPGDNRFCSEYVKNLKS